MPADELADRAVANLGRIEYGALQSGKAIAKTGRASRIHVELGALPFHVDDQPQLTVLDIRLKAQMVPGLEVAGFWTISSSAPARAKTATRNSESERD